MAQTRFGREFVAFFGGNPWAPRPLRRLRFVPQAGAFDGGNAALAMTLNYYGRTTTLAEVVRDVPPAVDGINALHILEYAEAAGLGVVGVDLGGLYQPGQFLVRGDIMHVDDSQFVVVDRVTRATIRVLDPARGCRFIANDASDEFGGVALLFADSPALLDRRRGRP